MAGRVLLCVLSLFGLNNDLAGVCCDKRRKTKVEKGGEKPQQRRCIANNGYNTIQPFQKLYFQQGEQHDTLLMLLIRFFEAVSAPGFRFTKIKKKVAALDVNTVGSFSPFAQRGSGTFPSDR